MALSSMTGFARAEGGADGAQWVWEVRSVNAKGLDVRVKLPYGCERLEGAVRDAVAKRFKRGAVGVTLTLNKAGLQTGYRINRELLDQLTDLALELKEKTGLPSGGVETLIAARGVMEPVEAEETPEAEAARDAVMVADLKTALVSLGEARDAEGEKLDEVIAAHLQTIGELAAAAAKVAEVQPERLKARIKRQVEELLDASGGRLDRDRLAQEAALLATKADVREEIDRLGAHIEAARELMGKGGPVGRKFDFLCQEFNRESNTICSKAQEIDLSRIGLDLKSAVEQLREQIQNIE